MKKRNPIPKHELDALVAKAEAYLTSPEGQQELIEAFERGAAEAKRLSNLCLADWDKLKDLRFNI